MANQKISELTSLAEANYAAGDLIAIVDVSASETKKTTIADLDSRYGAGFTVETRTVTLGEETAKELTLTSTPATPGSTILLIQGAPAQYYGDDYTVAAAVLSWLGLGLDGVLISGDKITILYK